MLYDGLYVIESVDVDEAVIRLSNEEHPIFKAHFPTKPILPGFVHFDIVAKLFDLEINSIKKAKFSKMVTPSQRLKYKKDNKGFKVFVEEDEVASFAT